MRTGYSYSLITEIVCGTRGNRRCVNIRFKSERVNGNNVTGITIIILHILKEGLIYKRLGLTRGLKVICVKAGNRTLGELAISISCIGPSYGNV